MADKKWLSSKDSMKLAKLKSCDLMHFREAGKLDFEKRGNAYYYDESSIKKLKH